MTARAKAEDSVGKKFGYLTVLGLLPSIKGSDRKVSCLCECGKYSEKRFSHLMSGHTKSCGCYGSKRQGLTLKKDLTDRVFGRLTVISQADYRESRGVYWHCKCSCGETTIVISDSLLKGVTRSCGCLAKESRINKVLILDPQTPRCLYLCSHKKYVNLYKIGIALPKHVRYRERKSCGGFHLDHYITRDNSDIITLESHLLSQTLEDLWIPAEFHKLSGRSELRRGPKIKELFYEVINE